VIFADVSTFCAADAFDTLVVWRSAEVRSPLYLPYISPGPPLYLLCTSPTSPLDLTFISYVPRLYLPRTSTISPSPIPPLHLPYVSPTSPLHLPEVLELPITARRVLLDLHDMPLRVRVRVRVRVRG